MTRSPCRFDDISKKRLVFISGKGGVGKTTLAVLLALHFSAQGKHVALVEMDSTGRIGPLFNKAPTPRSPEKIFEKISAVNLLPAKCFEEYVLLQIRFKTIYDLIFRNSFVTNFMGAIPGLGEALMLGTIFYMEKQTTSKRDDSPLYDLIIVDAPATGHGLSALEVPHVMESAIPFGPLHTVAKEMNILFRDTQKTILCPVTLAEEMPVTETREYISHLREKTDIALGPLFINAVMPPPEKIASPKRTVSEKNMIYQRYHKLASERSELNKNYLQEIEKSFPDFEKIILPFVFHEITSPVDFSELLSALRSKTVANKKGGA